MSVCTPGARTSWTVRTITATSLVVLFCAAATDVAAQGVRSHTRPGARGTRVTQSQAETLTLTLGTAEVRLLQTWVRTAGTIDKTGKVLNATTSGPDAMLVKTGQRVRAFPPSSKSSMYQAYVTRVAPTTNGVAVEATLAATGRANTTHYVMEIVVEQGPYLVVPNEAIIEEGGRRVVYVDRDGEYVPMEVETGIQGELYTQVIAGLQPDTRVVTFGSFFIDAEHKLKGVGLDQ